MGKEPETICEWSQNGIANDFGKLKKDGPKPTLCVQKLQQGRSKKQWLCKPKPLLKNE